MTLAEKFILRLQNLKEGERSRLRRMAGMPLNATVPGFDLFTGLWWPLRAKNQRAPRRETSWLVAKLFGAFRIPQVRGGPGSPVALPAILGKCEPAAQHAERRFRTRFDTLLCSPLPALEPHLRWAVGAVAAAVAGRLPHAGTVKGMDWARLLDDLSIWDRGADRWKPRDVRDEWAATYLDSANTTKGRK